MRNFSLLAAGLGMLAMLPATGHADGTDILKSQCATCHALANPADTSLNYVWQRKAPDLYYAGLKFQRDWLVDWLQNPKPIRPAGYPYFKNVVPGPDHDEVDRSKLTPHPKLDAAAAAAATDALLALKPEGVVEAGLYNGQAPNTRMGALAFTKLRGCSACHRGEGGEGGLSGPELTDAGRRLQPDFIASYIRNPQTIDPHVWMPVLKMTDQDIQRLTGYLVQLGKEEQKP